MVVFGWTPLSRRLPRYSTFRRSLPKRVFATSEGGKLSPQQPFRVPKSVAPPHSHAIGTTAVGQQDSVHSERIGSWEGERLSSTMALLLVLGATLLSIEWDDYVSVQRNFQRDVRVVVRSGRDQHY